MFGNFTIDACFNIVVDTRTIECALHQGCGFSTLTGEQIRVLVNFGFGNIVYLIGQCGLCLGGVVAGPDLFSHGIVSALLLELEEKRIDSGTLFLHEWQFGDLVFGPQRDRSRRSIRHSGVRHCDCDGLFTEWTILEGITQRGTRS